MADSPSATLFAKIQKHFGAAPDLSVGQSTDWIWLNS